MQKTSEPFLCISTKKLTIATKSHDFIYLLHLTFNHIQTQEKIPVNMLKQKPQESIKKQSMGKSRPQFHY